MAKKLPNYLNSQKEMLDVPEEIIRSIEAGSLTQSQLLELIRIEAEALELSVEQAVQDARNGCLPKNLIGDDLDFLIAMLPSRQTP